MNNDNKTLKQVFEEYKDKKFYFVRVIPGNWGDKLIHAGAIKLAKGLGIKYEEIDRNFTLWDDIDPNAIIYIHGSGGMGEPYFHVPYGVFAIQNSLPNNIIIIGPSSVMLTPALKHAIKNKNIILFAREPTSYEFLKGLDLDVKALYLDKCTSLYLTKDDIINRTVEKTKCLFAREDEAVVLPPEIKQDKYDLIMDPCTSKSLEEWAILHAEASEIVTNRLHSAVLGTILGKPVTLFHNHWHKNYSMWEYCLKDLGVKWVGKPWMHKNAIYGPKDEEMKK